MNKSTHLNEISQCPKPSLGSSHSSLTRQKSFPKLGPKQSALLLL